MKKLNLTFILTLFIIFLTSSVYGKVTYSSGLTGEEFEMGNLLEWSTLQENNSKIFVVEKSLDGIQFEEAGQIKAAGNSSTKNDYSFMDIGVSEKKLYYRLKQIDTDDSIHAGNTILLSKSLSNDFSLVSLNSTEIREELFLSFNSNKEEKMLVEVLDETSTITLFKNEFQTKKGLNEFAIGMTDYPEGIYRVALTLAMEREVLVIHKMPPVDPSLMPNLTSGKKIINKKRSTKRN